MSDAENIAAPGSALDEVSPLDFNASGSLHTISNLEESTTDESAVATGVLHIEDKESGIVWEAIKRKEWSDIEARYKAGNRDKETVCACMAREAARDVAKLWPSRRGPVGGNDGLDELITQGYDYAIKRWSDYDPTKATKNGISGFIYKAARGHMRNAAHELFTSHGKYKHDKDDVLPVVSVVSDTARIKDDGEDSLRDVTGSSRAEKIFLRAYQDGDIDPDMGSLRDKAINAAADRAARGKSNAVLKWHRQIKAPRARAAEPEFQSREAREATELFVHRLLAPLPPKDREIISFAWGVEGVEKATPQKLAELGKCSVSTVYKRLGKLYVEIAAVQSRR